MHSARQPTFARARGASAGQGGRKRTLAGGTIGHFVEWFDWTIYGYMAAIFAAQMFPAHSAIASLIASFAAFAIGFVGRPLGAIVLSPLADRYGRRPLLSATILMTGFGSLVIALCPTYATIGALAPSLIVAARFLQGFAAGGEYQVAVSFLNEHANDRHRALSASTQTVAMGASILFATGVASLTTGLLDAEALEAWGWRLPFALGALLSLVGLYVRSGTAESPAFLADTKGRLKKPVNVFRSMAAYPREMAIVFVMQLSSVMFYLWMIYLPTYANLVGGLPPTLGFVGSIISSLFFCIAVPLLAAFSDRIGRRPFLIAAATGFFLFTYPLLTWLSQPGLGIGRYMAIALAGTVFIASNNAVVGTVFAELFPTRVRTTGIGIPYAICAALFGGTAPMVATWLQMLGGAMLISAYVMLVCVISIAVHVWLTPETFKRSLDSGARAE